MKTITAQIYAAKELDMIPWPNNSDGDYARRFLSPMLKKGCTKFIRNIKTELYVIIVGDKVLPLTVNNREYANSYVASPYGQYVSYLLYELKELRTPFIAYILSLLIKLLGTLFKHCDINKVATINNWMLSTNLHLNYEEAELKAVISEVKKHFPKHGVYFRSVSAFNSQELYGQLLKLGLTPILGRSVYLQDPIIASQKRSLKNDIRMLKTTRYEPLDHEDISESDLISINRLYDQLYLEKWSSLNPQFTKYFYKETHRQHTLHYTGFKKINGNMRSACGYFIRNGMVTTPILGFDTQRPANEGLYRMACFIPYQVAYQKNLLVHCSSGAAEFKRTRGAKQYMEYNFIDLTNQRFKRRIPWRLLEKISPLVANKLISLQL